MPLPSTMTPIATRTLTASAASIEFTNIPQTYTDLVIVSSVQGSRTTYGADMFTQYNGDTGTNYSVTIIQGTGSTASSIQASQNGVNFAGSVGGNGSGEFSVNITNIQNYSNTNIYKTSISRNSHASQIVQLVIGMWRSNAAINSIKINAENGYVYNTGSTFTVYGIKAA